MTPLETDHIIATRALDGNNFNLVSDFLRQNPKKRRAANAIDPEVHTGAKSGSSLKCHVYLGE